MRFLAALPILAALATLPILAAADDQTANDQTANDQTANDQAGATPPSTPAIDVTQLFATTCGWCHANAGRTAGRGPQLMDSPRSDEYLRTRIKLGKQGAMPAFGNQYSDPDIDQIIAYIRALKP